MRICLAALLVLGICLASGRPAAAKNPDGKPGAKRGEKGDGELKGKRKQFDADRDGKLSPAEKAAARDNPANKPGREKMEMLLRRFDANGNGKLDPDERLKAKEALEEFKEKMEERKGGAGGPGPRLNGGGPQGNAPGFQPNLGPNQGPNQGPPNRPGKVGRPGGPGRPAKAGQGKKPDKP